MIREIIRDIRRKRNSRWIDKHRKELYEKYDGLYVMILDCKVIATGRTLSDMPYGQKWVDNGSLSYYVPINPEHLFGCTIEELARRRGLK